jgi:glycosyltransferase involved in cell wall biosynthesis
VSRDRYRIRWFTPDKPDNISVGRQRIATHLREEGFDVDVVGTTVTTIRTGIAERDRYDLLIGTTRAGAIAATAIGRVTGKPVVVDHVDPIRQFRENNSPFLHLPVRLAENVAFRLADSVLFVYEEERERVSKYAKRRVRTNLGVDYDRFSNPDPEVIESARERLGEYELRENVAVYVGGLEPIYHVNELLSSVSDLSDWSLVVLGEGSLRESVANAADRRENVHYLGLVPHETIPGYLHLSDVGISLVDDPHTLKVLEYGAAGLSVVQAKGRAEERFGDLVEYADLAPTSIADAIERAGKRDDPHELRPFAARFDWKEISEDYQEVLKSII